MLNHKSQPPGIPFRFIPVENRSKLTYEIAPSNYTALGFSLSSTAGDADISSSPIKYLASLTNMIIVKLIALDSITISLALRIPIDRHRPLHPRYIGAMTENIKVLVINSIFLSVITIDVGRTLHSASENR
jgi:hypothetical protein